MPEILIEQTAEDLASRSLRVTVPTERVQAAEARAVRRFASQARLPGFRPGKAPEAVIRKRFQDAIRQTVLEEVVREGWDAAVSKHDLKPLADPSVRNLRFEDGAPIEFDIVVEVRPEIRLGTVGGFSLVRDVPPVGDGDVDEQINRLREQKAAWLPVEGVKPAPGQLVQVEVAPVAEDGTVGEASPYSLVLGQSGAAAGLEEKIMELLPGETADADVRYPEDHPDVAKRSQTRRVRVSLREVKRQEIPPLDDAFAREVGEFDDLAALRHAIRHDLEHEAQHDADAALRQQLVDRLVEANGVTAPPSLVERFLAGYAKAYQVPEGQQEAFATQFRPVAEQQVKRDLVIGAVAEQQQLFASEADVDARVAKLAEQRGQPAGQVYASLQKAGRLQELERSLTEEKVFTWLLAQSTVKGQS